MLDSTSPNQARKDWLSLLATAPEGRAKALLDAANIPVPAHETLRAAEIGSVMVQGRAGGTGAPFNLGEVTVTRASLRLTDGTVGHGYVQGRRKDDAETAALIDAMMQGTAGETVSEHVLTPLRAEQSERCTARAEKAAATKVDFFTMVRGDNA